MTQIKQWNLIKWSKVTKVIEKLQRRIYDHSRSGNSVLAKHYQKMLLSLPYSKLLAIRRVTQDNRGKRTVGVDGVKYIHSYQRMKLVREIVLNGKADAIRRVWIPKPGTWEKRPLGIPTMRDRAKQAWVLMALEPEWEARFEPNSYGFRPGRSCHDAIEATQNCIRTASTGKFVLAADISKCFDRINHEALLQKLQTLPKIQKQIRAWLKAPIWEQGKITPSSGMGTPQGGVISAFLANVALHGMEEHLRNWIESKQIRDSSGKVYSRTVKRRSLGIVRYADDLIILHKQRVIIDQVKLEVEKWLEPMGLELKETKTRVVHTDMATDQAKEPGFDFLGFNIRRYKVSRYKTGKSGVQYRLYVKPAKESIKRHLDQLKEELNQIEKVELVTQRLNPIIKGWCNYFRTVQSSRAFARCGQQLYLKLMQWVKKKHPRIGLRKLYKNYFIQHKKRLVFGNKDETSDQITYVIPHRDYTIIKYVKVRADKSVYDGDSIYWAQRLSKSPELGVKASRLLHKQRGRCAYCGELFKSEHIMEVDHIVPRSKGGRDMYNNLQLLHGYCHDQKSTGE